MNESEEIQSVHKYLDDQEIPRKNNKGETHSLLNRVKVLDSKWSQITSDLEDFYQKHL